MMRQQTQRALGGWRPSAAVSPYPFSIGTDPIAIVSTTFNVHDAPLNAAGVLRTNFIGKRIGNRQPPGVSCRGLTLLLETAA
jgi:hypothetical protein